MELACLLILLIITSYADFGISSVVTGQLTTYVGEQFTLPCHTSLSRPVDWSIKPVDPSSHWIHIYWDGQFVNGFASQFAIEQRTAGEYNLVILNPQLNNTGEYKCEEDGGLGDVHRMHLNVTEIPTHVVTAGQRVRLSCHNSLLNVPVNWMSERMTKPETVQICTNGEVDSKLSTRYRLDILSSGDNNLIILHPQLHDSGKYTCIENEGRGRRHPMDLIVLDTDRKLVSPVGSMVAFGCDVLSRSRTKWNFVQHNTRNTKSLYDGHNLTRTATGTGHMEVLTSSDRYLNVLRIQEVRLDDAGKYTCHDEKDAVSQQTYELVVLGNELQCSISALNCAVLGSHNFTINCDINYSGNLHPIVVCSHGHSSSVVLKQHDGLFTNNIPLSENLGELSCHCKAAFNASYNPAMLHHAFTWTTSNVLQGTECRCPITSADTGDSSTSFGNVCGILFGLAMAAVFALTFVIIYILKCRSGSQSKLFLQNKKGHQPAGEDAKLSEENNYNDLDETNRNMGDGPKVNKNALEQSRRKLPQTPLDQSTPSKDQKTVHH